MKPEYELAKKRPGTSQLARVRAARAIIESRDGSEAMALRGFLTILHPEISEERRERMVRLAREQ
jgi:hypothetical protein